MAEIVAPANAGHLTAVGPVSASNGLPTWYKDDDNVRLEPCLDPRNSLCGALADETPDPDTPGHIPRQLPTEVFYTGALNGPVIGTPATVDSLGNWEVRVTSTIAPANPATGSPRGGHRPLYGGLQPARSSRRRTLPVAVFGISSITSTSRGYL